MSLSSKTNNNIKAKANTKANVDVDDEWSSFITGVCDDDSDDVECNINYDMLAKYDIKNDIKNDNTKKNIPNDRIIKFEDVRRGLFNGNQLS